MKLESSVFVAGVMALLASGAMANDVVENLSLAGLTTPFDAVHTDSASFTDTFTFDVTGAVEASVSGITIGLTPEQNIDFTSAMLNGQALSLSTTPGGFVEAFYTSSPLALNGPLVLTIAGNSGAAGGVYASYAGTLNVAAVPEPETYALMLAGLGAVGFVARRRRA